jgi:hypothetical protein
LGHLNVKRDVLADRRQEKYISIELKSDENQNVI